MKRIRRSRVLTGILFLLAVVLLFAGTIGATLAALQAYAEYYIGATELDHIGVTLLENGTPVSAQNYNGKEDQPGMGLSTPQDGNLVLAKLGTDTSFQIGKKYDFEVSAQNTGAIPQYVRVTVYRYWVENPEGIGEKGWFHGLGGNSTKSLNDDYKPEYICTGFGEEAFNKDAWARDPESSTVEREVYYYRSVLSAGATSAPLYDKLWVDPAVAKTATVTTTTEGNKTITTYTYAYDGYGFVVQAELDAIQTHNAKDASLSAWGVNILDKING